MNEDVKTLQINKKDNKFAIIGLLLVVALFGLIYYLNNMNRPEMVYKNIIRSGVDEFFDILYQDFETLNNNVELGFNLNLNAGLTDEKIIDLVNKTKVNLNYQIDKKTQQLVFKLDSDYGVDSLIDIQLFIDNKNEKTHLYLKDYFEKFLEIDITDYSVFSEIFEENALSLKQNADLDKVKKIVIEEFTHIITPEDCYKEDDFLVFEIEEKVLINRIKSSLDNLKKNEEFLSYYKKYNEIKEFLKMLNDSINEEDFIQEKIKISIQKDLFSNRFNQINLKYLNDEIKIKNVDDKMEFEIKSNEQLITGYFKAKDEKGIIKNEVLLNSSDFGTIQMNLNISSAKNNIIDKIDNSKVTHINNITEEEMVTIMEKLQNSKLIEIINSFGMLEMEY